MGIWAALPWQAPEDTPLPHQAQLRGGSLRAPSLPAGEEFLLTGSPSLPKPAFLVGQEPECQACLQEELQGCSWENRSSDTSQGAKPTWRFPDLSKKPLFVVLVLYSQDTPSLTSCLPCWGYPDKIIKLCWSTLVPQRMSQQSHYFSFWCHSCTLRGGRGTKGSWQREEWLLYLLSWLQHHFKKPLLPHLTPVAQFKHQKGLVMEKTLLGDCC